MSRQSGERHGLYRPAMAVPYLLTAGLLAVLIVSHVGGEPVRVSGEDGLVEWGTVVCFALCAGLSLLAAATRRRDLTRRQAVLVTAFGLLCLLAVGEELSWGQRVWGFAPPAAMDARSGAVIRTGHNDVTIHNLTFDLGFLKFSLGGVLFAVPLLAGLFVHGVYLPWAVRAGKPKATALVEKTGLFLPPLHLGILVLAGAAFFHHRRAWDNTDSREYKEMLVPLVYMFILLHAFFRRRDRLSLAATAAALALLAAGLAWSVAMSFGPVAGS